MSFPILLNLNNQVSTNQFRYRFSQPLDFSQFEIALGSVSIYYSWKAITAQRGNNKLRITVPNASFNVTSTITFPDGTYTAADINSYLQYWSIQNNLYLINNSTGEYYYFLSCAENPAAYAIQFNCMPIKNITGYTAAAGLSMPATSFNPQITITDSGPNSFGSIVGLSQGTYPQTQTTSAYSVTSNIVPQIDPVSAIVVGLSNLYNPFSANSQVLHTFTAAGVPYGALITTSQGQGISFTPMQGMNNEIMVTFMDQDYLPLQIIDPNVCIRLLLRPKKSDMIL